MSRPCSPSVSPLSRYRVRLALNQRKRLAWVRSRNSIICCVPVRARLKVRWTREASWAWTNSMNGLPCRPSGAIPIRGSEDGLTDVRFNSLSTLKNMAWAVCIKRPQHSSRPCRSAGWGISSLARSLEILRFTARRLACETDAGFFGICMSPFRMDCLFPPTAPVGVHRCHHQPESLFIG